MVRRQGQGRPRYGLALAGSWAAAQGAKRMIQNTISSYTKRRAVDGNERSGSEPVTPQGDVRRDYTAKRRRRVPLRVKRRARVFKRRVQRVVDGQLSPLKCLFSDIGTATSSAGGQVMVLDEKLFLNTCISASVAGQRDFYKIAGALADTASSQTNLRFRSSMLEVSVSAKSTQNTYVEVYTVAARKRIAANGTTSFSTFFSSGFVDEPPMAAGSAFTPTVYGVTPFHNRGFCESFKILKKEVVYLPGGGTANLRLSGRPPRVWNWDESSDFNNYWADKYTIGYIFVVYGTPDGTTGAPQASGVTYNVVRTYQLVNSRPNGIATSATVLTS